MCDDTETNCPYIPGCSIGFIDIYDNNTCNT